MPFVMSAQKITGLLFLSGAVLLLIPYTLLTMYFNYPDILREAPGVILTRFRAGGAGLIWTWLAFALVGLPLIPAYLRLDSWLSRAGASLRWATALGVAGLLAQMVGLLRWVFVVPVLAARYPEADQATQNALEVAFQVVHQYGGVLLGEHLGQLFTIFWTVAVSVFLLRLPAVPRWIGWLGLLAALVYLPAQAELLATVMPGIPVWEAAGFLGSTLWLIWLMAMGKHFLMVND
jgi:hypothetical protein